MLFYKHTLIKYSRTKLTFLDLVQNLCRNLVAPATYLSSLFMHFINLFKYSRTQLTSLDLVKNLCRELAATAT